MSAVAAVAAIIAEGVSLVMRIGEAVVKSEKLQEVILRDVMFGVYGIPANVRGEHLSSYVANVKEQGVAALPDAARREYTGMTLKERQQAMVDRTFRNPKALYLAKGINVLEKTASVCRTVLKALEVNGKVMQGHIDAFLDERITGTRLIQEARTVLEAQKKQPAPKPEGEPEPEGETPVDPAEFYAAQLTMLKQHADKNGTQDVLLAALAAAFGPVAAK